jgi:hypothetical protein
MDTFWVITLECLGTIGTIGIIWGVYNPIIRYSFTFNSLVKICIFSKSYDEEKYKEMIFDATDIVLGYFEFLDCTAFAKI